MKKIIVLLIFFTLSFNHILPDGNIALCQTTYTPKSLTDGGTIGGKVVLKGTIPEFVNMIVSQDNKVCGKSKRSPRLVIGADRGVANAVIYLEGLTSGKPFPGSGMYLLDQRNCEYSPHISIIPNGQKLTIVNSDVILHNVHSYETDGDRRTIFNIAQPIKGVKSMTKPLTKSGILLATCDAGHPWMSAYVVVASNPYYAITDTSGRYRLENIPPGNYTLHMWHEGVAITKKEMERANVKRYEFEEPYEDKQPVSVPPKSTVMADFSLTLR